MTMDRFPVAYLARGLLRAVEQDNDHHYVLTRDLRYRGCRTEHFQPFAYGDQYITFTPTDDGKFDVVLKAGGDLYDGTSLLPDRGTRTLDALFRAHFVHDAVYERAKAISQATGVPESALRAFADDCLKIEADAHGANRAATGAIHTLLRSLGGAYHWVRGKLTILVILTVVIMTGCYAVRTTIDTLPDDADLEYQGPVPNP